MRVLIVTFALLCALAAEPRRSRRTRQTTNRKKRRPKTRDPRPRQAGEEAEPDRPKSRQNPPSAEEQKAAAPKPGTDKDKEEFDVSEVPPVVTHHQITLDGKLLKYTATTGRLPIKRGDGKIEAEMFFVAYTLDGQDADKRPLTFAFNGGPGSATIWLHMGALGPEAGRDAARRLAAARALPHCGQSLAPCSTRATSCWWMRCQPASAAPPTPSCPRNSWASKAISKPSANSSGSISRATSAGVRRCSSSARVTEPRAPPALPGNLADQGISFNGITLLSTALSFQTLVDNKSNDQPYILLIPTFTMIAGYHKKLPPDLMQDMDKARQESVQWAVDRICPGAGQGRRAYRG